MGYHQYSPSPRDRNVPWPELPVTNVQHTRAGVVIIGAGISGICTAVKLLEETRIRNVVIIEQGNGFGGTWRDSRFPGCCCDVFSALYQYSFDQNTDWSRIYPGQEEILNYLEGVASKYRLHQYTRFSTSVDGAAWDENENKWKVNVSVADGKEAEYGRNYTITCDFLVSGVGQLNRPQYPDIPGIDDFQGKWMHSARWDWSMPFDGRIAVVGTGATSAQIVPEIAKRATHLTVCQRSPGWVIPRHDDWISEWKQFALSWVPGYQRWHRAWCMRVRESFFKAITEADSPHAEHMRELNQMLLDTQLPDRPDLREKLRPKYDPGCKRSVLSDDYYPTLAKPNVTLEDRKIERVTKEGILFHGDEKPTQFDLIIYATGFRSMAFLEPILVNGLGGRSLKDIWSSYACAYKGVSVESLPNFGMLYGPNTNLSHNSEILVIEAQARYIAAQIKQVLHAASRNKSLVLTVNPTKLRQYTDQIQDRLQKTSFADARCSSWWRNEDGWIPNNWAGTAIEYQDLLSKVDWRDYDIKGDGAENLTGKGVTDIGRVVEEHWMPWLARPEMKTVLSTMGLAAAGMLAAACYKGRVKL